MFAALVLSVVLALTSVSGTDVTPPPGGVDVDYQLGGASTPAANVGVVVRDRKAKPAAGSYNVCYVNGFQTQPGESRFWRDRWSLVLKRGGKPVVDEAWGEWLLDIRTPAKRVALARVMGRWIDRCARDGFDAVEFDNLDSWSRSHGLITRAEARRFARHLVKRSHERGLAAGQKNWAEFDGRRAGFDFAVAEECGRYDECGDYVDNYGSRVLVIEYRAVDFRRTCDAWGSRLGVVLRDRELAPTGPREWC